MVIIETEGTFQDLEEALAWAFGESDVVGKAVLPLAGAAAKIYEILTADTNRRLVQNVLINDAGRSPSRPRSPPAAKTVGTVRARAFLGIGTARHAAS